MSEESPHLEFPCGCANVSIARRARRLQPRAVQATAQVQLYKDRSVPV